MSIRKASARTTVNAGFNAARVATTNAITIAPATATTVAGGGTIGGAGVTISNVAITDSTFANVLSGDTAIGSLGGFVRITGSGFQANAGVFFNNVRVANTFVSSTQINANIPATTAGTYNFYVFNTDGSGANFASGLITSGFPAVNVTSYTVDSTFNQLISATGDAPLSFSIQPGSSNTGGFTVNAAGYISGTSVADGAYALTVIVDDAQNQSTQADLTVTVVSGEPYFNLTTLLLPGNGTNNANNQAFTDSSTNNFTITRNGNATQGTFSPFSPTGWSNFFVAASSQYIFTTNNNAFKFGAPSGNTNDFCVEFFVYPTGTAVYSPVTTGYSQNNYWAFGLNRTAAGANVAGYVQFYLTDSFNLDATSGLVVNTWNHIAAVRTGTTVSLFVNGTRGATATSSVDPNPTGSLYVGAEPTVLGRYLDGSISNLRIIKGATLPYSASSSSITVPTAPLTAITGTTVLTCQSNRFLDNSSNALVFTPSGGPSIQAFSPFAPTASYNATAHGGSGYFDGTGDNLVLPTNTVALQPGTGDYTIELFYYATAHAAAGENYRTIFSYNSGSGTPLRVFFQNSNGIDVWEGASLRIRVTNVSALNQWNHLAVCRSGSTTRAFYNGTSIGDFTASTDLGGTLNIGNDGASGLPFFTGYMSSFRVVKGTALYTASFTPPTAPLTAISNTQFLASFTNAGITDATAKNVFETAGDAKISTAQSKFGGSSMFFDGVDDYLTAPYAPWASFGTGQFTIECWVYFDALTSNRLILDTYTSAATGGGWQLYWRSTGTSIAYYGNGVIIAQSSFTGHTTGVWYHLAVTRDTSNFLRIFVDGTQYANVSYSSAINVATTSSVSVGIQKTTLTNDFAGYIDDVRVTVGYARYTANFTAPTAAFRLR